LRDSTGRPPGAGGAGRFVRNAEEDRAPRQWGSLARKGTRQLKDPGTGSASSAWRDAVARAEPDGDETEIWIREADPEPDAPRATKRQRRPGGDASQRRTGTERQAPAAEQDNPNRKPRVLPAEVNAELHDAAPASKVARLQERLTDASGAYERQRYRDAARMLKPLAELAPGAAAVRELYGLTQYRLGNWAAAIVELEAFRAISGALDQHPTLADCYRAKKRYKLADELWEEMRLAPPSAELMAEARIVHAGSLADRGRLAEAIELLERGKGSVRKPKEHHLRTWYVLADLYERAGEVPRARELFRKILEADPDVYDTAERLASIG